MSAPKYVTLAAFDAFAAEMRALLAPAPAIAAPVVGTAEAPLYVSERAACTLHTGCTRKLSDPTASHERCTGATDPMHLRLRKTHRHF
jgi:hypothetical protein